MSNPLSASPPPAQAKPYALPAGIFLAALLLRIIGLGSRPFWLDEIFTQQRVSMKPADLVHDAFVSHHMPTFFLLLAPFVQLGNPQFWLRAPSAVFGALSVMLVYLIGSRIAGRTAGLIAALVLGLSPAALAYSQEARSYTLVMCLILVALLGFTHLASDIPAASLPLRDRAGARAAWASFILASIAAVDVLADAFLWVLTANLIAIVISVYSPRRKIFIRNMLIADLCIFACSLPFYILMTLTMTQSFTDSVGWIPGLSRHGMWYSFSSIYLMRIADAVTFRLVDVPTPAFLRWGIAIGLVLAAGLGAWRLRQKPALFALVCFSFLVLPIALTITSLWHPILLPRYILWSAAPFAILAGIGGSFVINPLSRTGGSIAFAGIAALLLVNLLPYYTVETKPRWDIAAQILAQDVAPGDVVFLNDQYAMPELRAYLPKQNAALVLSSAVLDLPDAQLAESQGKRVWAVFGIAGQSTIGDDQPQVYAAMAPLGTPTQIQMAGSRIYITLFVTIPPTASNATGP